MNSEKVEAASPDFFVGERQVMLRACKVYGQGTQDFCCVIARNPA